MTLATNPDPQQSTEISWRHSWLLRWGFPLLLTLISLVFLWVFILSDDEASASEILVTVLGIAIPLCYARYLDRAKRVWMTADGIQVSNYMTSISIPQSEIAAISESRFLWPTRLRIDLHRPTVFGSRVLFFPPPFLSEPARQKLMTTISDQSGQQQDVEPT